MNQKESKFTKFFNDLNPLTLLFALVIVVSLLTYIIPAGQFDRVVDETTNRTAVVPGTFHTIESNPATPITILMSFDAGLKSASSIISFLLLIGGALGVISSTGAIESALSQLVKKFGSERSNVIKLRISHTRKKRPPLFTFSKGGGRFFMVHMLLKHRKLPEFPSP